MVSYAYDSGANAKGKLVSLIDQAGTASYAYDTLGRMSTETRVLFTPLTPPPTQDVATVTKSMSYEYNLDGSLKTLHYPSGAVVTYTPDSAGRILSAVDGGNGINYITGATYGPDGALTGFVSGYSGTFAGITSAFSYNKRLQPVNMSAASPSQTLYSIGYDFHVGNGTTGADNGNVFGIYNYRDRDRDQSFIYDALNRLVSAQNAGTDCTAATVNSKTKYWGNSYSYDAWGNLLQKSITKCGAENLSVTADAHNWIHASGTDYQYDAAGNMTYDATAALNYSFDQENRITGANGYTYTYDGDGNRVIKSNGNLAANGTLYWAMTPGVVAETDLAGTTKSEYVFFGGERVARKDFPGNAIAYYFSDHLKTASVITDSAGNIKSESDFYPWGSELQFTNNDSNHYKFTGKERDGESGLDYFGARYYSGGLGRWVSADWAPTPVPVPYADFGDPQSLNLYAFVRGVPTSRLDPDGHDPQRERAPAEEAAQEAAIRERDKDDKGNKSESKPDEDPLERAAESVAKEKIYEGAKEFAKIHPDGYDDPDSGVCYNKPPNPGTPNEPNLAPDLISPRTKDPLTGEPVGRFIVDPKGNTMIEPEGGSTVPAGPKGQDTHTTYPNGSNYQRLNPEGHRNNPMPHGHAHLPGTGPGRAGQGPSLAPNGTVVNPNSPEAHWPIKN